MRAAHTRGEPYFSSATGSNPLCIAAPSFCRSRWVRAGSRCAGFQLNDTPCSRGSDRNMRSSSNGHAT